MQFAVCNELFGRQEFSRQAAIVRTCGFQGLEIAPHTVFGDFSGSLASGSAEISRAMRNEGLTFVGLHWLLMGPRDLHASAVDAGVWRRTWDHVARLIDLAGDLGGGTLVFGSPAQRSSHGLSTPQEALVRFSDGLLSVADRARAAGCRILLEALASAHTDIMNTLGEVRRILQQLRHPAIETVFDFHNVEDEALPWDGLVREYAPVFTHVHLNEPDGGAPSLRSPDLEAFRRAFEALRDVGYRRWVSLEIFTVPDDPAAVLRDVRAFLDEMTGR